MEDSIHALKLPGVLLIVVALLATGLASPSEAGSTEFAETFYFHYLDQPVFSGGRMVHYVMNTSAIFQQVNNSVFKPIGLPKLSLAFSLVPDLAGGVRLDGTWQVHIWVNASALKPTGWGLRFFEIESGGEVLWDSGLMSPVVIGGPPGSNGFVDVLTLGYNLSVTLTHTFSRGSTIVAEVEINAGASTALQVWYDSIFFPSLAILPSLDHIEVSSVATFDANGAATETFSRLLADKRVRIRTDITDPFGGYDVDKVKITLTNPLGQAIADGSQMARISGDAESYRSTYEYVFTYTSASPSGEYGIRIEATDNNGHIVSEEGSFNLGFIQRYLFQAVDSGGSPLEGATIVVTQHLTEIAGETQEEGLFGPVEITSGGFDVRVVWRGVVVNSTTISVPFTEDVTEVVLWSGVYDSTITFVDSLDEPLPDTPISITFANGSSTIRPVETDEGGQLRLERVPGGSYSFLVYWQDVLVNSTSLLIESNEPFTVSSSVYYASFEVVDDKDTPLEGAFVIIAQANGSLALLETDPAGVFVLEKVPTGRYSIKILWKEVEVNSTRVEIVANTDFLIETDVFQLDIAVVDNGGNPVEGASVLIRRAPANQTFGVESTDEAGQARLIQLPVGVYNIDVDYATSYLLTPTRTSATSSVDLTSGRSVTLTLADFPPPFHTTFLFYIILLLVFFSVAFALIVRRLRRGGQRA